MYKYILCVLLVVGVFGTTTTSASACEVEGFVWTYSRSFQWITISGKTSCETGRVTIYAFDSTNRLLGDNSTHIEGYLFTLRITRVVRPHSVRIKYTIKR